MNTDQATVILASLLRSPRRFRSYELSQAARQRLVSIQHLLETYDNKTLSSDYEEALARLNQAYRMLDAVPPAASSDDLSSRMHPMLLAFDNPNLGAEGDAWRMLLAELRKK
jgi:hypothetical protein